MAVEQLGQRLRAIRRLKRVLLLDPHPGFAPYAAIGSAATSAAFWRSISMTGPVRQLSARVAEVGSGKMSSSPPCTLSKTAHATDPVDDTSARILLYCTKSPSARSLLAAQPQSMG